ncbi:MAG: DUF1015 family protein [Acidimicrobiales bacterium]
MPRFEPFAGLRYREPSDLGALTAPPYDVIDERQRAALASRSPYNAVRLELPVGGDGEDPYQSAARLLQEWRGDGVLVDDDGPSFYLYRMGYRDEQGRARQTSGVIGALELSVPGEGDVLPHEHTTPKAKSDRLALLEATQCNLSPIWGLSLAKGLGALAEPVGPPLARCTDELGAHHRLWRVTAPAALEAVASLVGSAPVVIADGHHRYETALAHRDRRREHDGGAPGPHDLVMALVVELAEDELSVQPIHRLLRELPADLDVVEALAPWFEAEAAPGDEEPLPVLMDHAGALGLALPDGTSWLLAPRAGAFPDEIPDLDSSRLDVARAGLPAHEVTFQHGASTVLRQVKGYQGRAGVLLRPATVAQITATAERRDRMPPKTTYFHPKLRTGMVFRSIHANGPPL